MLGSTGFGQLRLMQEDEAVSQRPSDREGKTRADRGQKDCPVCGRAALRRHHAPHSDRSVASDGHLVATPLDKWSCAACGYLRAAPADGVPDSIWSRYGAGYDVNRYNPAGETQRAASYAECIVDWLGAAAPATVLEVGCGAGRLLQALQQRWPLARFEGLEPSGMRDAGPASATIQIAEGFIEDRSAPDSPFDLCLSVNVIEHSRDPHEFLSASARQVGKHGKVLVICPEGRRPNTELLFADHLHSFSSTAMALLAARASLVLTRHAPLNMEMGDFHAFELARSDAAATGRAVGIEPDTDGGLFEARERFFGRWRALEAALTKAVAGRPFWIFGASEFAFLLRAYCPGIWDAASGLTTDDAGRGTLEGRPLAPLTDLAAGTVLLLGVRAGSAATLQERLTVSGFVVINPWTCLSEV